MSEADIVGGILRVTQGKTKAKLRIIIDGELKTLLEDITAYKTSCTPKAKVKVLARYWSTKSMNRARQPASTRGAFRFEIYAQKAADDAAGTSAHRHCWATRRSR